LTVVGTVPPEPSVARRLVERGHRVEVLGEDSMRDEVLVVGGSFRPWERGINRPDRTPEHDFLRDWGVPHATLGRIDDFCDQVRRADKILVLTSPAFDFPPNYPQTSATSVQCSMTRSGQRFSENVTVVASAPHSEVLKHASVVVTHGGDGTMIWSSAAG
jgi:hypothetical protein